MGETDCTVRRTEPSAPGPEEGTRPVAESPERRVRLRVEELETRVAPNAVWTD
jgi:hypothetical protein